ncbi:MAG: alpha-xylosidase [Oscillospiraceae bacterium]|nr:alpha-xylosidase [Oscillospiraceae bacterium]
MKFSDGFWLNKKNYDVKYACGNYRTVSDEKSVTSTVTPYIVYNRGMTLGGPNLEVTISSEMKNVIKVSIVHFKGACDSTPGFELFRDDEFKPDIAVHEDYAEVVSGDTRAVIKRGPVWDISFEFNGRKLTHNGAKSTSYIIEDEHSVDLRRASYRNSRPWDSAYKGSTFIREQLSLDVGENIYGFGEKFTPFVKNGQTIEIWNSDGGTSSDQSYKCVPFCISSKGYGVFVNSTDKVSFEVGSDSVSKLSFTVPGEKLEYFIIGGETPLDVISTYTALTGRPALPPAETFGLWLTTSFTTDYNEKTVLSFIDKMKEYDIPLQVFHFDCFWMKEYQWTNFEWNTDCFPDPNGMLKKLKDRGLSVCVWINPYIAQESVLFDDGMRNGFFIKNTDGSVFQTDMWQPGMAIVDFTNPAACEWFKDKIRTLCRTGVDYIKTDFGERIPVNVKYSDGSEPEKMHNLYSLLYNRTVYEALEECHGKNKACVFARSATAGGQRYPVHWGGDCTAEYVSMAETLRGGLSLCLSGFGFFSHDISGFEDTATPDLYKRWCAFGLLSTHSRLHGNSSYRVPWLFDEEAVDVLRFFTKFKGRLMPYLYAEAVHTHETGIPMMRAMFLMYPDDPVCLTLDRQYMLGDSLLCAPVFREDGVVQFYLPEGNWTDIITGEKECGGKFITRTCSYMEMPVYAKENSLIPYGDFKDNFAYDYYNNTEFVWYSPVEDVPAHARICDTEGRTVSELTAVKHSDTIKISYKLTAPKPFSLTVHGTDTIIKNDGTCLNGNTEVRIKH